MQKYGKNIALDFMSSEYLKNSEIYKKLHSNKA